MATFISGTPSGPRETNNIASLTGANTDASGGTATNLADLATGATNGSWVTQVDVTAGGTTTQGQIRFFLYDGTNRIPYGAPLNVTAAVPSGSVAAWSGTWYPPGNGLLKLPTNWKLQAATYNAETFKLLTKGGDY